MFKWGKKHKTIRELRRKQGFTARELAAMAKVDTVEILKIDDLRLKDIREPMKSRVTPYL
jgi:transcriptional regulator with XRE-family HTH domain